MENIPLVDAPLIPSPFLSCCDGGWLWWAEMHNFEL